MTTPRAYAAVMTELARNADRTDAAEVQTLARRAGEVELAAADVGAAVDDAGAHDVAALAQREAGATRQRLVGDADRARRQAAAAADLVAVQAGAVPRHGGAAVGVEAADALAVAAGDDPHRRALGARRPVADAERAPGAGDGAGDGGPAVA